MFLEISYFGWIVAVAGYMVASVLVTEWLKKYTTFNPLIMSWVVGILFFLVLYIFGVKEAGVRGVVIFIALTGFLNGAYKFTGLKRWIRKLFFK